MRYVFVAALLLGVVSWTWAAENLMVNPSAEEVTDAGHLPGWGLYIGAGRATLTQSADYAHEGKASACLELTRWYTPPDEEDVPANHSISVAAMLGESNGYKPLNTMTCEPGTTYVFTFWYRGDVSNAKVSVTGWPADDADHTRRIHPQVAGGAMAPADEWRRCTGSFRASDEMTRFAVMVQVSGKEAEGFKLGRLYLDDVRITAKAFPDGELRAMWWGIKATDREAGMAEMLENLDKAQAAGFNTIFASIGTLYVATLDNPDMERGDPKAAWDYFGELIKAAKQRGIQVHAWFSPWIYKNTYRAPELREHPEWAEVNSDGVASGAGICFVRPEVRQYELDAIAKIIERYPDLAGIHIEEPGHSWGDYCYCDYCHDLCLKWFGVDIREDKRAARPIVRNLAAFMSTDFFARLRQLVMDTRPELWVSANGSGGLNPDWYIGRDWATWARRGYIDFYVPQLYTRDVNVFISRAGQTASLLGNTALVTGMAVSWSGIYPDRQDPEVLKAEIRAAREMGAAGFVVFHRYHFYDEHYQAVREVVGEAR
ncbi:MAG: family 10 glycosylhydrolase [Armatimonadetes bacterium]|nr:family 10 glycosylhydrolase [Armatimonadota bacterium]